MANHHELSALFRPKSLAVVGASPTSKFGRQALELLKQFGYSGKAAVVNPKYEEVLGYPCYPSIKDMPFVPEAVFVLRDAKSTLAVIEQAADIGVRAAVVVATGFGEAGAEGAAAQARIVDVARSTRMEVLGPNATGLINWVDRVHLNLGAFDPSRRAGSVALFSQGGGAKNALVANTWGVRWSHAVSCGNEAVLGSADFLRYFINDPHVRVICGFVETIRDPEPFFFECERARAAGKPVILLKPGRTEAARKMATAHTGALAAPYRLYRELFKRHGVVQVDSYEELLASALVMQVGRSAGEGRIGLASPSGGALGMYMDETAKCPSLSYPQFQPSTAKALRGVLSEAAACNNPVDFWPLPSSQDLEEGSTKIFQAVASDPNVDIFATPYDPGHVGTSREEQEMWANCAAKAAAATNKLITLLTPVDGSTPRDKVEDFVDKDVVVLGQQQAFRALDRAVAWRKPVPPMADEPPIDKAEMAKWLREFSGKPFAGKPALDFLGAAGIPVVESRFVTSVDAAISAAGELGYPVVAKIGDTGVLHRTELSGVLTNLRDAPQLTVAAKKLFATGAQILIIQPYVRDGVEMILGLETDDVLGTFVLVGQGGIWTEIMDDAALRPAGLRVAEPEEMLAELRAQKLLHGVRGAPALDTQALFEAVRRIDSIARSFGNQIRSIDINPLFVRENGVVAVDALIVPAPNTNDRDG